MQRARHDRPDWETHELLKEETNDLEISGEPDTTSHNGRQMSCYKGRQMNWRHAESQTLKSETGRQMNCYKRRQTNWKHGKSQTLKSQIGRQMNCYIKGSIRGDK